MNTSDWYASLSQRDKRALIFNILYAAEGYDYQVSVQSLVDNFNKGFDIEIPLEGEIVTSARAVIEARENLDLIYKPLLANWRLDRIGVCTKLILRYAIWELSTDTINSTIVINEAVELAKCYAEQGAYKFVNGILDQIVHKPE